MENFSCKIEQQFWFMWLLRICNYFSPSGWSRINPFRSDKRTNAHVSSRDFGDPIPRKTSSFYPPICACTPTGCPPLWAAEPPRSRSESALLAASSLPCCGAWTTPRLLAAPEQGHGPWGWTFLAVFLNRKERIRKSFWLWLCLVGEAFCWQGGRRYLQPCFQHRGHSDSL